MLGIGSLPEDYGVSYGDDELMGGDNLDAIINRFAALESDNGRNTRNPSSKATGLLQFMPDTWAGVLRNYPQLGLGPGDIENPDAQRAAARVLLQNEVVPALRKRLGREPTGEEIYTAWGLGTPDAQKLFTADPNAPGASLFKPVVAEQNPATFYRDKGRTQPRTVAEVMQWYADRWNGAKTANSPLYELQTPTEAESAKVRPFMQRPEVQAMADTDWSQIVAGGARGGIGSLGSQDARPQMAGISALNPYMQIAAQLMPERGGSAIGDALINAGAAMMQSRSPDFLGGAGAGLAAGNQALQARRQGDRQDILDRFKFGMQLAQYDQKDTKPIALSEGGMLVRPDGTVVASNPKDAGEWAVGEGVMFNKKTGEVRQVADKPLTDQAKLRADFIARRISKDEFDSGMAAIRNKDVPPGYTRDANGGLQIDPSYLASQKELRTAGATTLNVNNSPETKFAQGMAELKVDAVKSAIDGGRTAVDTLRSVAKMEDAINSGLQTGTFAPAMDSFARLMSSVGVPQEAVDAFFNVKDAKVFQSAAREMVLAVAKTLGPNPSNADREFIEQTLPKIQDPVEAVKAIVGHLRTRAEAKVKFSDALYSDAQAGGDPLRFELEWQKKNIGDAPWKAATEKPKEATPNNATPPAAPAPPAAPSAQPKAPPQSRGPSIVPQIKMMDMQTLRQLDVNTLSPEERAAARQRYNELYGANPSGAVGQGGAP